MDGKVACILLLLLAYARAEDVDTVDLKQDIAEGQKKVSNISKNSEKEVQEVTKSLNEIVTFFNSSIPKYLKEAEITANDTRAELISATNKFIGDAIDKNRPLNTFNCILKVAEDTSKAIQDGEKTTKSCIKGVWERQYGELQSARNQLVYIKNATTGLYDSIYKKLEVCKSSNDVAQLVHSAEVRENNLAKLLRTYRERGSDLRVQFNEGQLSCLRSAKTYGESTMKACTNKMKAC